MASGAVGYDSVINRGNGSIGWLLVGLDGADCHLQVLDVATANDGRDRASRHATAIDSPTVKSDTVIRIVYVTR